MNLKQLQDGYRYNSDTLLLYNFIQKCDKRVLDVGCGCGILGLLLKRDFPKSSLTLLDIQPQNCELSRTNAKENGLEVEVLQGDFLELNNEKFDIIVSNPPFYHDGSIKSENSHLYISRYNANLPLEKFINHAKKLLTPTGRLIFCYDAKQIEEIIFHLHVEKFRVQRLQFVHSKADKAASLVLVEARRSSKSLATILAPIVTNDEKGYTQEVSDIFKKADTKSVVCD